MGAYIWASLYLAYVKFLRGSLPKSGPLDYATKNSFPLFFVGVEALVELSRYTLKSLFLFSNSYSYLCYKPKTN